jgi:glucose-6-phosphate dehydrogenase assembly protein OpcA
VAELEAALSALWKSLAEYGVTRACALTLLVYVENEEDGREVSNLISAVTQQHPCRAIVIVAEPEATPPALTASISAHCHLPGAGATQVCCEQIALLARGDTVKNLHNVVVPLTVSGLPVHLWWRADRFPLPQYFEQILRVANHLLLDSARLADPERVLQKFSAEICKLDDRLVVTDLNWARITPWRELIAQFFDSVETRPYLDYLSEVRMGYDPAGPFIPARRGRLLLVIGWLASRLNWEPVGHSGDAGSESRSFRFASRRGAVEVTLAPLRNTDHGPAVTITLVAKSPSGAANFWLASALGRKSIVTRLELPGRAPVERTVHLPVPEEVELVNEEVKVVGRDRVFEQALRLLEGMTSTSKGAITR